MTEKISIELLSIGVAHAVYRNTEVEDFHAECRLMDKALYDDVYKIVSEKVNLLIKNIPILIFVHQNGLLPIEDFKDFSMAELDFLACVLFGIQCGIEWDMPENNDLYTGGDITEYLLNGEFKKRCDSRSTFDDTVTKPINKDIVNRIYSVLKQFFNDK